MRILKIRIIHKPALFLVMALITGILISYFILSFSQLFLIKLILAAELLLIIYYYYFYFEFQKKKIFIILSIILLFVGSFSFAFEEYKFNSKYSLKHFAGEKSALVYARISFDLGDLESDKVYLKPFKVNNQKIKYGKIVSYSDKLNKLKEGELISLNLDLNQAEEALNPGGFSFANYLKKEGVYLQGWEAENINFLAAKKSFKQILIRFKLKLLKKINLLFKSNNAAFIKAILLGEKEYLNYEQETLLRNSGASHLLAISGLHMGIIILTFSFILFKIFSKRKTALYFLSFLTFIYIIIVGAAVSIIRASSLALLFLWADEFNREGDFLNIISLSLIINLLLEPQALFTISLQLSYILVLALFYLTPLLNKIMPPIISVSLAAQLGAFAISVYYFNEYSWIAILTNLWVIPFITVLLPIIFLVVLLSLFIFNYLGFFVFIIEFALKILFSALNLMTEIQGLAFVVAHPHIIMVICYYLLLFSLVFIYQKRYLTFQAEKFIIWKKVIPAVFLILVISFFINFDSDLLEVNYLAVGQGDGIFIKFPNGKNMIIDTGPPGNDGRKIEHSLISYLNYYGIKKIDYLMISHFDADHVGGMPHLLKRKKVQNVLIPPFKEKTSFHQSLEQELNKNKKLQLNYLKMGSSLNISNCSLKILNPQTDYLSDDRNENSLVFLLKYGKRKFLFTGDLSKEGENRIIDQNPFGKIDILKAGHHGSNTSSGEKLLLHSAPKLAVISVGRNNFGHPSPEVLKRFKENKVEYLRTDKSGRIKVSSDGENIWLNSFK